MSREPAVLLAAGGTGGHLFPAEALAVALANRNVPVELATDDRALRYGAAFPARAIHTIPSATPTAGSTLSRVRSLFTLIGGTLRARSLLRQHRPLCVVGFGGYPTVPPVLAATMAGIPSILHEQNAVMGRANRLMATRVTAIATGFAALGGVPDPIRRKATHTGNPVRPAVLDAALLPFPGFDDHRLQLLVTGGSQGARVMSDVVPPAIELLSAEHRSRLAIVQQARSEDEERVAATFRRLGVEAVVAAFFPDLPARMAQAHLVIARAGASTVSELAVIGRPSILVPFPFALDQDQAANAAHLAGTGAATVVPQREFTPEWLASRLVAALADPTGLTQRAQAARSAGIPDAAERLADLVIRVSGRGPGAE